MLSLPEDLKERAKQLFLCTVKYASEMLLWEEPCRLGDDLRPQDMRDTNVTMLFNDEVHTYDQVIGSLQKAVDCEHKEAVEYATTVDRDVSICRCYLWQRLLATSPIFWEYKHLGRPVYSYHGTSILNLILPMNKYELQSVSQVYVYMQLGRVCYFCVYASMCL